MTVLRHVRKVGHSYSVFIPKILSDILDLKSGTTMYSYLDGNKVVYTKNFKEGARKVRVRVQSRYKDTEYYAITIPMKFVQKLGIKDGDVATIEPLEDGFSVSKFTTVE